MMGLLETLFSVGEFRKNSICSLRAWGIESSTVQEDSSWHIVGLVFIL